MTDYEELDRKKVLDYLKRCGGEASVADVLECSGADTFRIYSLIQKLRIEGSILITDENSFGSPLKIRICL